MGVFFGFFFLSGLCSLVYQVVWLRVAMAGFGVTTPLVSIVLSIFMGGLALGSWAGGRLVKSMPRRPASFFIALYGAIELVIGLSGVAVAPLLRVGRAILAGQAVSWASGGYYLASAGWVACVMLPFCACMGATFPVAMAGIRALFREKSPTSFSYLYLANVLGAMVGALGSAFVLIELLGFSKTLWVAAALNGAIAIGAFATASARSGDAGQADLTSAGESRTEDLQNRPSNADSNGASNPIALPLLFTSGLASLGMEVVWTRQFIPMLGPVVYSFAAMLAVYLGATAVGSRVYRRWTRRNRPGSEWFASGVTAILAAVSSFLPLWTTDPHIHVTSTAKIAILIIGGIGPFCAVTGFMTPMLVDRWSAGRPDRVGRAYAVNAVGCILGPLLAGFVLLPAVGERWSLAILALPFFAFGLWPLLAPHEAAGSMPRPALSATLAAALVASILLVRRTHDFEILFPGARVRRDYTATSIAAGEGMNRRLLINGVGITNLTPITKMMAHLPMASLPNPPRNALILCFGMGTSFRSALSWNVPVTVVELVPSVPSLVGYFHADGDQLLRSPNARVVIDDARRFLERTRETFDVIVIDPPPPVEAAGSSLLYSSEFYEVVRAHLKPGGILQQWLPEGDPAVQSAFAQSLRREFADVRVFGSVEGWGYHFLASMSPLQTWPPATLAERLPSAARQDIIEWGPKATPQEFFETVMGRERRVEDLIGRDSSAPMLTDDRPVNEYYLLRKASGGENQSRALK